ncbi:VOC family protein [Mycobacterium colombiense]|uniref:Glyoxalase/bleomycin resistance protein n=1 Tax=Mycobacterium colombiense CECT 3035 TaxID=1041522 RepID=J4JWJ1_9MYCO|nr:VOC family protein [Mycobacterium colombiense]EJO90877.1 glyoxalase/bleomycin resistance protein [Mycobacterium colombiense CECT 3035]
MTTESMAALAINHVGLTVPDVFAAIDWYGDVFGFRCIMGPRVLEATGNAEAASVFGNTFRRAWQAHLITGNYVGIELFQFLDPPTRGRSDEPVPWLDRGLWHLCITHPDVEGMVRRVTDHGGTVLAEPYEFVPGRPWRLAYVADPWGTVLELMSHSYAEAFGNWPQPGQSTPPTLVARAKDVAAKGDNDDD